MPKKDLEGLVAVIYARYSSENQREESIEGQLRECYEFARKNDISVVGEYIDRAFSAKTDRRPDFQRMIKDSTKRSFNLVIVWKLDRFARNRYDSAHYKTLLKKNGVKVMSATERISDGAEGILLESVLEGMAEYYSADLAEKVTRFGAHLADLKALLVAEPAEVLQRDAMDVRRVVPLERQRLRDGEPSLEAER